MKLHRLTLENYRGFASAQVELDPDLTVIVGVNGAGKTSLLEAIATMLSYVHGGIRRGVGNGRRLADDDVRVGASTAQITLETSVVDTAAAWTLATTRAGHPRKQSSDFTALRPIVDAAQEAYSAGRFQLPLAVYYPTNRSALDIPTRIRERHAFGALDAYDGALDAGSRNFRLFFEWFREQEDFENEQRIRDTLFADPQLRAVRRAIEKLVTGVSKLRVQRRPQRLVVNKGSLELDVSMLSDGEKCLLAMVADLARRMALASPTLRNPLEMPAVVAIDEIDLHLHPAWQRVVVGRLREVFPETQFIVSTHSPQVLGEVHARNVRLLDGFRVEPPRAETWGRDSNRILSVLMGARTRTSEVEARLHALGVAEDEERWSDAWREVDALVAMLGDDDPDVTYRRARLPPREDVVDAPDGSDEAR